MWLKITRDPTHKLFTLALGLKGEVAAFDVKSYPFGYCGTWAQAEAMARQRIADFYA